jgi:hypothetical protein
MNGIDGFHETLDNTGFWEVAFCSVHNADIFPVRLREPQDAVLRLIRVFPQILSAEASGISCSSPNTPAG